jgi:hypothetical protein
MSNQVSLVLRSPRVLIAAGVGVAAAVGVASYILRQPKPTEEELERARREGLARTGRITDGTILDTILNTMEEAEDTMELSMASTGSSMSSSPLAPGTVFAERNASAEPASGQKTGPAREAPAASAPHIIVYKYRIAGVSYECAQDVSTLAEHVHGIRSDLPIQVRYELHNPGNSIVVAESWNGLRLISSTSPRSSSKS